MLSNGIVVKNPPIEVGFFTGVDVGIDPYEGIPQLNAKLQFETP